MAKSRSESPAPQPSSRHCEEPKATWQSERGSPRGREQRLARAKEPYRIFLALEGRGFIGEGEMGSLK